jgi:hypothetical protein
MPEQSSNLNNINPLRFQLRQEFADYYQITVATFRNRLKKANIVLPKGKITPAFAKIILEHQGEM